LDNLQLVTFAEAQTTFETKFKFFLLKMQQKKNMNLHENHHNNKTNKIKAFQPKIKALRIKV